jgi:hypothetical protein
MQRTARSVCISREAVLQLVFMGHTLTIRLDKDLAAWVEDVSKRTGVPQGQIVRTQLERARAEDKSRPFMRLAGCVRGVRDLSGRKGFSKA